MEMETLLDIEEHGGVAQNWFILIIKKDQKDYLVDYLSRC